MAKPKRGTKELSDGDTTSPQRATKEVSYGEASSRLEEILQNIEEGQVDIDALSALVKEAADLVTLCRQKIHAAEIQVQTITEQLEREAPVTTVTDEDDEDDEDDE
ncbi:exodeoxyribonuclease VII small subunit [Sorangium sp. So ce327]|jgi:exodeoxyribonuclease VII small subunit|uniref:exodeoxyribonuclease VII small subunit n=1 Tax=Sorangium sp. So ce327 TaxID=3133301 RepID=UPI003F621712